MDSHAILAWKSMRGEHGGSRRLGGVPRSRRRPGMMRDQAMTYRRRPVRSALAACATVLLVAASSVAAAGTAAAAEHGLKKVHDPGRVTGTIHGHCSYRDHGQLPDPRCTPGSIDPDVTHADIRSTICKKGWTGTVRPPESQTERFKYDVAYPAYGTSRSE